ncbi:MAG: PD40 domain-containing protein [Aphanocapsa lilacina HA4352-LM1]|nr:PD40 domain-containing protein [Aphanocapsa lilacina HA4352-LM1]
MLLTPQGYSRLQEARRRLEFRGNFGNRYTLDAMSERTGLAPRTLSKVMSRKEGVDRQTLEQCFHTFGLQLNEEDYLSLQIGRGRRRQPHAKPHMELKGAPNFAQFYGREQELATLKQWIVQERSRLVAVLGMGGIGKTCLCAELLQQIHLEFEYVLWRSVRNGPLPKELLADLVRFFSHPQELELPASFEGQVYSLLAHLRKHRCLFVLDNIETLMSSGSLAGRYRPGFEEYGFLFGAVGSTAHNSCLVLTSREQPQGVNFVEGKRLPVRLYRLGGLGYHEGRQILLEKGLAAPEGDPHWKELIRCYAGNPLALKIVASTIRELFDGQAANFLQQGSVAFGGIYDLLEQHYHRLSDIETECLYWLAVNREPVLLSQLQEDVLLPVSRSRLLEALESLRARSLIECGGTRFTLLPVVLEYTTDKLLEAIYRELVDGKSALFRRFAILKAQSPEHVKDAQIRFLLKPLVDQLLAVFGSRLALEHYTHRLLGELRRSDPQQLGYAVGNLLNILCHCGIELGGYDFSTLTVRQADLRGARLCNANFQQTNFSQSIFTEALSTVSSVAFSPDGQLLATSEINGTIRLWQAADAQQLAYCRGHTSWVWSIAFSPDGRVLASGSADRTVRLWDYRTGQCLKVFQGHEGWVRSVAFHPGGGILASGSEDAAVRLWEVDSGRCLLTLRGHSGWIHAVRFSPNGQWLASSSQDGKIQLWHPESGEPLQAMQGHTGWVRSIAFAPDGQTLISGSDDQTLRLWDVQRGILLKCLQGHTGWVRSVDFSPDGRTLASGSDDQTVRLWDADAGLCFRVMHGHSNWISSVVFSPDGRLLTSGSVDHSVRIWETSSGHCLRVLQGHGSGIWSVAFRGDGKTLASGSIDHSVRLWDFSARQPMRSLQAHTSWVRTVAFSPDGTLLASSGQDRTIKLWDPDSGRCLKTLRGHTGWVNSLAFSPNGALLASSSVDHSLRIWNVETGQCLGMLQGHTSWVRSVAFHPDGRVLASASQDKTARLWDIETGRCLWTLQGHTSWVRSVAFHPDGHTLASGSDDGTIKLWDVPTGRLADSLSGHGSGVWSVVFAADGKRLASGGDDKTVRLWDTTSMQCTHVLNRHASGVLCVAIEADSRILASSSADETITLWDLQGGNYLGTMCIEGPYTGMNITGATGLSEAQLATLKALGAVERDAAAPATPSGLDR